MKKRAEVASILGFLFILLYANRQYDIRTISILIFSALIVSVPCIIMMWRYKGRVLEMPKGLPALIVAGSIFLWRWLDQVSEGTSVFIAFVLSFMVIAFAFFCSEEEIVKTFQKETKI